MLEILSSFSRLFDNLKQSNVPYALFKGLDGVDEVLAGAEGDVDVLFPGSVRAQAAAAFVDAGFFVDRHALGRVGDDVVVYRAFDVASARSVMVHAYFRLLLGDAFELHYPQ